MKFVSKSLNYEILLRGGVPANLALGTPEVPAVFVRFEGGVAEVQDEKLIEMMYEHPGYGLKFVSAEMTPETLEEDDPFHYLRPREKSQTITEMEYGRPVKRSESPVAPRKLPESVNKLIREQALDIAKQMLPELMKQTLLEMKESQAKETEEAAPEAPAAKEEMDVSTKTEVKVTPPKVGKKTAAK